MDLQSDGLMNGTTQTITQGGAQQSKEQLKKKTDEGRCCLLEPVDNREQCNGLYDKPLACFGCGVGWFCFTLGFALPLLWYIATALFLGKYYLKDPRERAGLAASAIAALICSVAVFVALVVIHL